METNVKFNRFNPASLTEAREARGLTKSDLALSLDVSQQMVTKYEKGQSEPSGIVLNSMSKALNLPIAFFFKEFKTNDSTVFFRSQAAARVKSKKIHSNRIKWLQRVHEYFEEILDFPAENLPLARFETVFTETSFDEIDQLALALRNHWGLGVEPISNLTLLLEKNGIIISASEFSDLTIDACSTWNENHRPYVFLSYSKGSAVRSRFDLAHELGHLLLHSRLDQSEFNKKANYKRIEKEANHFASTFLLPEETFADELKINSLSHYILLKERWKASIAAMLYRAEYLGLLSDYQVLHTRKTLAKRKMRINEPLDDEIPFEKPQALKQAVELIIDHNVKNRSAIINEIGLSREDIEAFCNLEDGYLSEVNYSNNVIPFSFKNRR